MNRGILFFAGLLGALAVIIGAFAAHGLPDMLSEQGVEGEEIAKRIDQCETAVRYHMFHTVALLLLGFVNIGHATKRANVAAVFFALGIALFSGGLYSMVFAGEMGHWAIVPSGGLCFIIGWLFMTSIAIQSKPAS